MRTTRLRASQTWAAVIFAVVLPTIVTWVYFIHFDGRSAVAGAVGKGIQFAFPVFWVFLWLRIPFSEAGLPADATAPRWSLRTNVIFGVIMGLLIVVATVAYYQFAIFGDRMSGLIAEIESRVKKLSLAGPAEFVALGAFYSLVHSFLEEYYFRWFVFGRLRTLTSFSIAATVSAVAFMAHHVIVLAIFFGNSFHTYFLSLSIAVGGWLWAYQYERSGSLIGPWLSHLLVDAGIFLVGYHMLFFVIAAK